MCNVGRKTYTDRSWINTQRRGGLVERVLMNLVALQKVRIGGKDNIVTQLRRACIPWEFAGKVELNFWKMLQRNGFFGDEAEKIQFEERDFF